MKKLIISILIFLAFGGMDFAFAKFYNPLFRPFITAINTYDRWVCPEGEGRGEMDGTHPSDCYDGITDLNSTLLKPGSTLYAHGYFSGEYKSAWAQSGSLGKPITITAYDKANPPTFDGIYELVGWTESGTISEMWYHSSASSPYVMLQERGGIFTVLEEVGESGGTCEYVWGATRDWCYDPSEDRIYVMATDGTYDTEKFHRFRLEWANFSTDTSYISVRNVIVKNYTRGFYLNNNNSSTVALGTFEVDSVTFERVRVGIAYVPDNGLDGGNLKFNNNTFDYVGHSILMTPSYVGPSQISEVEVINNIIENAGLSNSTAQTLSGTVTDEWLMGTRITFAASGFSDAEQVTLGNVSDAIISHNVIGPGKARGIVMDCQYGMDVKDIIIEYNVIKGLTYTGMITFGNSDQLGDEYEGIIIRRNQLIDNGLGIDGSDVGWYSDAQRGAMRLATTTPFSAANYVVNNSFYGNYRDIRIEHSSDYIVFKNNILQNDGDPVGYNGAYVFVVTDPTDEGIDYNLYYPITGCPAGECWYLLDGYYNWATWSGTYDTNSPTSADPKYVNPATYDLNLQAESPALNAGIVIAGIIDDYCGSAPDLGYIEASCPTNIYVDKANEGGTEDGSIGNPWGTIAEGLTQLNGLSSGAHTVHIAGDTYSEGALAITISGQDADNPLTIQPWVGEGNVIIDGSGLANSKAFTIGPDQGVGVSFITIKSTAGESFTIQDFEDCAIYDYAQTGDESTYLKISGLIFINNNTDETARGTIRLGYVDKFTIENNTIQSGKREAIVTHYCDGDGSTSITINNNTIYGLAHSAGAFNGISFAIGAYCNITNNTVYFDLTAANQRGIRVTDDNGNNLTTNVTVSGNTVYASNGPANYDNSVGIIMEGCHTCTISQNIAYNWGEWGIDVGGGGGPTESWGVVIERNLAYNNWSGNIETSGDAGYKGASLWDAIIVKNNVSYASVAGLKVDHSGFGHHDGDAGTDGKVYWLNNTHYTDQSGYHGFHIAQLDTATIKNNNVWTTDDFAYRLYPDITDGTLTSSFNNWYRSDAGNAIKWEDSGGATEYLDSAALAAAETAGDDSVTVNPSFLSAPTDLHLNSGSSVISDGDDLSGLGVTDDYDGNSRPLGADWDIGAYEYLAE